MKAVKLDKSCFVFRPKIMRRILAFGSASFLSQISIVLSMAATLNMAVKYGALEIVFGAGLPILLPMLWGLYALPFFMPAADALTFIAVAVILLHTKKSLERS